MGEDLSLDLSIFSTVISCLCILGNIKSLPGIPRLPRIHESLLFTYTAGILNTLFCFDWTPVKLNSIFPSAAPCRDHGLMEKGERGNGRGTPSGHPRTRGFLLDKMNFSLPWHQPQHLLCLHLPDTLTGVAFFKTARKQHMDCQQWIKDKTMWGGGGALLLLFQPYYYFFNLVLISPVSPGCLSFTVPSTCLAQHSEFCSCLFQLFLTSLAPSLCPLLCPSSPAGRGELNDVNLPNISDH